MQMFLLLLVAVLIILVLGLVYFSHRQLNQLRVAVTKNSNNITQLASVLDTLGNAHAIPSFVMGGGAPPSVPVKHHVEEVGVEEESFETRAVPKPAEYLETVDDDNRIEEVDDSDDSDDSDVDESDVDESQPQMEESKYTEPAVVDGVVVEDEPVVVEDEPVVLEESPVIEDTVELDPTVDLNVNSLIDNDDGFPINAATEKVITVSSNDNSSTTGSSKGRKKRIPEGSARDFDLGYQKVSENDGKVYEVVEGAGGRHRWKMMSNNVIVKEVGKSSVVVEEEVGLVDDVKVDEGVKLVDVDDEDGIEEEEEEEEGVEIVDADQIVVHEDELADDRSEYSVEEIGGGASFVEVSA